MPSRVTKKPGQDSINRTVRDRRLDLILSAFHYPSQPNKFHIDNIGISRGTFFKVKNQLIRDGLIRPSAERGYFHVDLRKVSEFLEEEYPGIAKLFLQRGEK